MSVNNLSVMWDNLQIPFNLDAAIQCCTWAQGAPPRSWFSERFTQSLFDSDFTGVTELVRCVGLLGWQLRSENYGLL